MGRSAAPPIERESGQNSGTWTQSLLGNVTEPRDVGEGPGESFLFFLTVHTP